MPVVSANLVSGLEDSNGLPNTSRDASLLEEEEEIVMPEREFTVLLIACVCFWFSDQFVLYCCHLQLSCFNWIIADDQSFFSHRTGRISRNVL